MSNFHESSAAIYKINLYYKLETGEKLCLNQNLYNLDNLKPYKPIKLILSDEETAQSNDIFIDATEHTPISTSTSKNQVISCKSEIISDNSATNIFLFNDVFKYKSLDIIITHIVSCNEVYVQPIDFVEWIDNLIFMEKLFMDLDFSTLENKKNLSVGEKCIFRSVDQIHRGMIEAQVDENVFSIKNLDNGVQFIVFLEDIYDMSLELSLLRPMCFVIALSEENYSKGGKEKIDYVKLKEKLINENVVLKIEILGKQNNQNTLPLCRILQENAVLDLSIS